ncbi:phospho-N-acetylmuramoyl-pentapeptide-transferase [Feifania hominis]|nr:phospho-N-acetylmuramoyl-pentapeptide-transferase [Feifania hominis]
MPLFIPLLRKIKFSQSIREEGPKWHEVKNGTPTMGGIVFAVAISAVTLIFAWPELSEGKMRALISVLCALSFGLIGFLDDYIKVVKKRNLGLRAYQKFSLQLLAALVYLFTLYRMGYITTAVYIPFINVSVDFGPFYYLFAVFVIVGTVNSVNLTDGLDGLATSVTVPIAIFFGVIAIRLGALDNAVFAAATVGALVGFLLYNFHPAKVFMGDTGSLFLGGAVCAMAFAFNMPVILVIVGFVYVMETISDILQVAYFKLTKGKRLFKMAPLHHHFEMSGWSEVKIVYVFSAVTVLLCILAFVGLTYYYTF